MPSKVYQLKISLMGAKPPIWRRILVESDTHLSDLHKILQTTMGWYNAHLHQFIDRGEFYAPPSDWDELDTIDYSGISIDKLLKKEKGKIFYEYDFGDGWRHEILLEKILEKEPKTYYPVCIDGKNACPPEDCGGIWGYANLLEIMADPEHEEYEDMMDWLGGEFDPTAFDKEEVNDSLGDEDFGVISLW